jgi:hypothetical protein
MSAVRKYSSAFDVKAVTDNSLYLGLWNLVRNRSQMCLHVVCEMLLIVQRSQTWRRCESLRLYLADLTSGLQYMFLKNKIFSKIK